MQKLRWNLTYTQFTIHKRVKRTSSKGQDMRGWLRLQCTQDHKRINNLQN
jgi:hypothetical protein